MDKFVAEIESYAARVGLAPSTIVQRAVGLSGSTWAAWRSRSGFPTAQTMDRLRDWIKANPPPPAKP